MNVYISIILSTTHRRDARANNARAQPSSSARRPAHLVPHSNLFHSTTLLAARVTPTLDRDTRAHHAHRHAPTPTPTTRDVDGDDKRGNDLDRVRYGSPAHRHARCAVLAAARGITRCVRSRRACRRRIGARRTSGAWDCASVCAMEAMELMWMTLAKIFWRALFCDFCIVREREH